MGQKLLHSCRDRPLHLLLQGLQPRQPIVSPSVCTMATLKSHRLHRKASVHLQEHALSASAQQSVDQLLLLWLPLILVLAHEKCAVISSQAC